jgi:hypothetical protein
MPIKGDSLINKYLRMIKKINLQEFEALQLTLAEKLNIKGDSRGTASRRNYTMSTAADHDFRSQDCDS